jgi:chaperonin GroES
MDTPQEKPLAALLESVNIADKLDKTEEGKQKLRDIGSEASRGFETDLDSRKDWEKHVDEWTKLARQAVEPKTWPWPRASNIKYPILSTAALQFAARAYPSLLPSDGMVVKARAIGKDPDGAKSKVAEAVSTYMSFQLLEEMDGWEEEMDKLLIMLPIVGTMFKKTYWDSLCETNVSTIIMPKNLVVNYWTRTLRDSERISEILEVSARKVKERQQTGMWLDVDLGSAPQPEINSIIGEKSYAPPSVDSTTPYTIIEQHTYLDLDDDGYKEPYIVTFHKESHKVLRIAARFDDTTIKMDEDGKIKKIDAIQYYTKFGFIPNPDGSFYDIGFGVLLGPINESVNTLINQLVDAGTLNNLQSGFLGKGLRLRMGETRFQPGEWKVVNSTGDDLKKQIVPMPSKEPSNVLFQLMGSLITSGKELASIAEIFTGKMPGQNTPATTTMATVEQGMKVFTAVYKRLYRALTEEFKKIARLNELYLNPQTYVEVVGMEVGPDDFKMSAHKIYPGADPTAVSQTEKLLKAQGLMELMPLGILDPVKVGLRILEAQEQPNFQELLNPEVAKTGQPPAPPPDPKVLESQAKVQAMQQASQIKQQEASFKAELSQRDQQFKQAMASQTAAQDAQNKEMLASVQLAIATHTENMRTAQDRAKFMQDTMHSQVSHVQKINNAKEMAAVKKQQATKGPIQK